MELREALDKRGAAALLQQAESVKRRARPFLGRISDNFPEYTIHDISHSEQVIANLDWLIPDDVKQAMNDHEIYFLLLACYLHDIGMFVGPKEKQEILAGEEFQYFCEETRKVGTDLLEEDLFQDFIRRNHHLRSEDFIVRHWGVGEDGLGIEDQHQAHMVARICRGHRNEDLTDFNLFMSKSFYQTNIPINVAYLAGMLRLADALDITAQRVPLLLYRKLRPRKPVSLEKWKEHRAVVGVGPDGRKIRISAVCTDPDIHRALNEAVEQIRDELAHVQSAIASFPPDLQRTYFLPYESIDLDVGVCGYKLRDFKFQLSEYALIQLLMGEKLYERREVGIRELLQNALDTCRQRQKLEATYEPRICFTLSADGERLVVEDNGMGMKEAHVERYFMRIGECYYRSSEFLAMDEPKRVDPISQFGIGILSCFLIADRIVVETKSADESALRLEIDNAFDYFIVRDGTRRQPGTTIELTLKKDSGVKEIVSHLIEVIRAYARHVEIPLVVRKEDGYEEQIVDEGYEIALTAPAFERAVGEKTPTIELFTASFKADLTEGIEGVIGFPYVSDESGLLRPHSASRWHGPRQLSQLGIWIPQPTPRPPSMPLGGGTVIVLQPTPGPFYQPTRHFLPGWLRPNTVFYELNLSGQHKVNLDLTRNRMVWDEKATALRRSLEDHLLPHFRDYVRFMFDGLDDWGRCLQSGRLIRTLLLPPADRRFTSLSKLLGSGLQAVLVVQRPREADEEFYSTLRETCPDDGILIAQNGDSWWFLLYFFRLHRRKMSAVVFDPEKLLYRAALSEEAPPHPPRWLLGGRAVELVDFDGPGAESYIARISGGWFLLNRRSPMVQVMIQNPEVLDTPERRDFLYEIYFLALEDLSRKSLRHSKPDLPLEKIQELHGQVIDWYVEAGIIAEHDAPSFQLTARELPWYASNNSED